MGEMHMKQGFTVIEMILSLIILGFVAGIAGYFYVIGAQQYEMARLSSDVAPKVQIALERISLELKDCADRGGTNSIGVEDDLRIVYRTTVPVLGGIRELGYDESSGTVYISPDNGLNKWPLLDGVTAFSLDVDTDDQDGNAGDEISSINFSVTVDGVASPFTLQVMPRNFVHAGTP